MVRLQTNCSQYSLGDITSITSSYAFSVIASLPDVGPNWLEEFECMLTSTGILQEMHRLYLSVCTLKRDLRNDHVTVR